MPNNHPGGQAPPMTEEERKTMTTYHNDPKLKTDFLTEIGKHEAADAFIKGTYGRMNGAFKGCAIGCSLASLNVIRGRPINERTGDHERLSKELGVPLWLAHLEDHLFEALPIEAARQGPRQLAEAIPVGVVIPDRMLAQILRWTLADATYGVRHATDNTEIVAIVDRMIALFDRSIAGDEPTAAEWDEDARDAWAAWAARAAWAAGTRDAFYPALRDYVITLLRELEPMTEDQ